MKYRKKPYEVDAVQWHQNGDHPQDNVMRPFEDTGFIPTEPREGAVVRYYRHPNVDGQKLCELCHHIMHNHGWIDRPEDGIIVCPGDWIITHPTGKHFVLKPFHFESLFEPVNEGRGDSNASQSDIT